MKSRTRNSNSAAWGSESAEVVRDEVDLRVMKLRFEAALSVIPLIAPLISDRRERGVVIADLVSKWSGLSDEVRESYNRLAGAYITGLELFGGDYVDQVERNAFPDSSPKPYLSSAAAERISLMAWRKHLSQIGRPNGVESNPNQPE